MISVVIPAHNEAGELDKLLEEFSSFDGLELVVAEDASTDGTPEIVQEFASRNRNVILTRSSTLTGKGAAIKRGLAAATGDVLGFIDADRSIHPDDFMRVVDAINYGADLAIGSRKLPASVILQHQPLLRRILGKPLTSICDDRYFVFDNFVIVAWFFIAVQTWPQWWVFLLPPALLVLDNFRTKYGLVFCILILITYLFIAMRDMFTSTSGLARVAFFAGYRIPLYIPALLSTGRWFEWLFTVLAGLLLFWVFALSKELSDKDAKSSTAT
jgi:glycosyltransferase involved in cell wall biosynthesis